MSNTFKNPSTEEFLFKNQRLICPLCNISFDNPSSPCRKNRVQINCPNCNKMLISCNICGCMTTTTKDKINYQTECGVHFYSIRVIENDINRVPKSHVYESISQNVVLLPDRKPNIENQL